MNTRQIVQVVIQLMVLFFIFRFCYFIIAPFMHLIISASILAVTLFPLYSKLKHGLHGKGGLAATLITVAMLAIFIVPAVWFSLKTAGEVKELANAVRNEQIQVPPPPPKVKSWPLIGERLNTFWQQASIDLDSTIKSNPVQMKRIANKGIGLIRTTATGLLILTAAIIISGVLLVYATQAGSFTRSLVNKLMSPSKLDMTNITVVTIRNVVKGILGVAVIQTTLAAAGMIVAGVPYAGLWALLCLILAIVQIGTLPIAIIVIIYIWGHGSTLTATLLTIWMLAVGLMDNILKPLVMGKGAPVPMLVIFLGAIGGFMHSGFIGLFTGAVILSLGYSLFNIWLSEKSD